MLLLLLLLEYSSSSFYCEIQKSTLSETNCESLNDIWALELELTINVSCYSLILACLYSKDSVKFVHSNQDSFVHDRRFTKGAFTPFEFAGSCKLNI